jgi:PrgI family protein
MEPVKVPQNLELQDVLVWGLGAIDLACLAVGVVCACWLYLAVPGPVVLRIAVAAPFAAVGAALAVVRIEDRSLREWLLAVLAYVARSRRHVYGGDE